jgi:hypothetical protein
MEPSWRRARPRYCRAVEGGLRTELRPMLVGEIVGQFFVPGYQRGYRWGRDEVTRLLDDIRESSGRKYFLQPVVAKRRDDGKWELVDGQQRLTTLLLILRYIHEHLPTVHPKYSLEYETRPGSADYLDHPAAEQSQDNIDFFHIFGAFSRIREWFESHDQADRHRVRWTHRNGRRSPSSMRKSQLRCSGFCLISTKCVTYRLGH